MPDDTEVKENAAASSEIEARIRARSRPVLNRQERAMLALTMELDQTLFALERCRKVIDAQTARAEALEQRARELQEQIDQGPPPIPDEAQPVLDEEGAPPEEPEEAAPSPEGEQP